MSDLQPPIEGMQVVPWGLPLMTEAWISLVIHAVGKDEVISAFKAETGHDLRSLTNASLVAAMADKATGRDRQMMASFCDWVTVNLWGDGTDPDEKTKAGGEGKPGFDAPTEARS